MDTKTLITTLSEKLGREPEDIAQIIKSLGNIIGECVREGDTVAVPTFGTFEPKMRQERVTTHPSTGRKILVPPKLQLVFKPSTLFKQKVRSGS